MAIFGSLDFGQEVHHLVAFLVIADWGKRILSGGIFVAGPLDGFFPSRWPEQVIVDQQQLNKTIEQELIPQQATEQLNN